ncbi:D-glycero-beta-D-manno-heptose-7-phosphate kinase [Paenalcaligenes niemegkensis]|uniref:D-glycero-beta-D-manno-heptose-7-phosphate kinase n=1 Tax=Paenalcaligenes niemegkensis TaxID=2895469 RepID=UPI001EE90EF6|nr:D-glycero-beta-D-manno-heptose-7-phosphate kinase [Paenalcaligenes niemegkensis]MCQ9616794.1 D-glycero-beta-D-manno-heptose-7-phosphate kinase [Paenalcaligenes niemegkensis]
MIPFPVKEAKQVKVLVIGDVMLDRYWFGGVERISPEAPVPVVKVARREDRLGGAANVARNIVALGAQATLLGIAGQDDTAIDVEQLTLEAGIHASIVRDPHMPTTLKLRVLARQQQLLRVDFEERPEPGTLEIMLERARQLIQGHDLVVLSDYAKGTLNHIEQLIALANEFNIPVMVDPKGDTYHRYRNATIITPNRIEMQQAVGRWADEDDLKDRAQRLRAELQLEAILITRSEQGMTIFTEGGSYHADAQAQEVFDVSGAGDTVLATLAVGRAAGLDWDDAMQWANIAGGIVVGKLGTSIVTVGELL